MCGFWKGIRTFQWMRNHSTHFSEAPASIRFESAVAFPEKASLIQGFYVQGNGHGYS
jgi:hypothetical protein